MAPIRLPCLVLILVLLFFSGCAHRKQFLHIRPGQGLELENTPFFPQGEYQCGPASLAMVLGASGVKVHPDDLVPLTYLPHRRGSLQLELLGAVRKYGRIPCEIKPDLSALIAELRAGRPVLVLQNLGLGLKPLQAYHYAVVIGVLPEDKVILRSGTNQRLEMDAHEFLRTWKLPGFWGLVALRPGELPAQPDPLKYLHAVNAFEASGNVVQAAEGYRAALTMWPKNQLALFALGNNHLMQGGIPEARVLFQELLAMNPDHVAAANNLAETFARQGCYTQAVAVINRAVHNAEKLNSPLKELVLKTRQEIIHGLQDTGQSAEGGVVSTQENIFDVACP